MLWTLLILMSVVNPSQIKGRALILFDNLQSPRSYHIYPILDVYHLENLLGHFRYVYYHKPVGDYRQGEIFNYNAVFYFGTTERAYLPPEFLKDVLNFKGPVVWFKNNFNNFQSELGIKLASYFGFKIDSISYGYDVRDKKGFYRIVEYKGFKFKKWFKKYENGSYEWDAEIAVTSILNPSIAKVVTYIDWWGYGKPERKRIPHIIKSRNIWFVSESPFSYIGVNTPYTIFCDLLHDILGQDHRKPPRALVRLEDISPIVPAKTLKKVVDYLYSQGIPFSMAVIPVYKDPYKKKIIYLHQAKDLVDVLKYAVQHGGLIFMHGTTHQQEITTWQKGNVTAVGYEYFDFDTKSPIAGDNMMWVYERMKQGLKEFQMAGLPVTGFEVPHYAASRLDYFIFGKMFELNYHRPSLYIESPDGVIYENQLFPYVIYWDIYGETLLPENLGFISNYLGAVRPPDTLINEAKYILAVRDGIASFFWHPTLADYHDAEHFYGIESLKKVVRSLRAMGFKFVSPAELDEIKEYFGR